jgi:hypothetical protein
MKLRNQSAIDNIFIELLNKKVAKNQCSQSSTKSETLPIEQTKATRIPYRVDKSYTNSAKNCWTTLYARSRSSFKATVRKVKECNVLLSSTL